MRPKQEHSEEYMKGYHNGYVTGLKSASKHQNKRESGLTNIFLTPSRGMWYHIDGDDNTFVCPFCENPTFTDEDSNYIPKFCMECGAKLEVDVRGMTNNEATKLIREIEEDGRNVTSDHVDALELAIKALEFINENYPKTFIDYLHGDLI